MRCLVRCAARALCTAVVISLLTGPAAHAMDARLAKRLDAPTAAAVDAVVREAAAQGLPTEPLVARALEGAMKHAPGPRIVAAVRASSAALGTAATLLPAGATSAEFGAAAGALLAGVAADTVRLVIGARPGRPVTVPLVVLADLVSRRVPAGAATASVLAAARAGLGDDELLRRRDRVSDELTAGRPPLDALRLGFTAAPRSGDGPPPARRPPVEEGRPAESGGPHGWQPEMSLESGVARPDAAPHGWLLASAALSRPRAWGGWSAGASAYRGLSARQKVTQPRVEIGVWRRTRRLTWSAALGQTRLTMLNDGASASPGFPRGGPGDSLGTIGPDGSVIDPAAGGGGGTRHTLATTAQLGLGWGGGPLRFSSALGWRVAPRLLPTLSATLSAAWWLTPHVALAGSWRACRAGDAFFDQRLNPGLSLALRLGSVAVGQARAEAAVAEEPAPGDAGAVAIAPRPRPAVEVLPLPEGGYRLRVTGLAAWRVELAGDFNDWRELRLAPASWRDWQVTLAAAPGAYGANLRIDDGAWLPLPGCPERPDGFGGRVGLLVLP